MAVFALRRRARARMPTMDGEHELVVRVFLDALDDFERAIGDLTPAAAEGRPSDRLNSIAWIVAHVAQNVDSTVNVAIGAQPRTEFLWGDQFATGSEGVPPEWGAVSAAVREVFERARRTVELLDSAALTTPRAYTGSLAALQGRTVRLEYRVARLSAHLYTHIGEIQAIRSTLGLGGGDFPGPMSLTLGAAP